MISQLRLTRLKRETKVDNVVVDIYYRPPDQEEVCDFLQAVGRIRMLAGPGLIGELEPP